MKRFRRIGAVSFLAIFMACPEASAEPDQSMMEALKPFHPLVGTWKGTGTSTTTRDWKESLECTWGFREKDGRVALEWRVSDGNILTAGVLSFDPKNNLFKFTAKKKDDSVIRFEGGPQGPQLLRLLRKDEGYTDKLDRLDIKLLREGDKLMYVFARKRGSTSFETIHTVELFRVGEPLASFANGPRCVITGGAGRVKVEHNGTTVFVACEACKEEFLAHPERYSKK